MLHVGGAGWFRELCALCWMFHVRERLSDNCRRYQAARESVNNHKVIILLI